MKRKEKKTVTRKNMVCPNKGNSELSIFSFHKRKNTLTINNLKEHFSPFLCFFNKLKGHKNGFLVVTLDADIDANLTVVTTATTANKHTTGAATAFSRTTTPTRKCTNYYKQ